jgi:hypothetical protein
VKGVYGSMLSLTPKAIPVLVAIVFLSVSAVKADIVQDGLIAYYSLDATTIKGDDVEDLVGDNDGIIVGGVKKVKGKFGDALEFNGTDGRVNIEGTDDLMFNGIEEFTVSAWVSRNGSGGGCCGPIIGQRDLNGWALRYDNRNAGAEAELIISPGWVGDAGDFGVAIPEGEWHHITGVLFDGTISMYFDGELEDEIAFAAGAVTTNGGTATTLAGAGDGHFDGVIDDALIYNRGLTAAEVEQNFESTRFGAAVNPDSKLATCWGAMKK